MKLFRSDLPIYNGITGCFVLKSSRNDVAKADAERLSIILGDCFDVRNNKTLCKDFAACSDRVDDRWQLNQVAQIAVTAWPPALKFRFLRRGSIRGCLIRTLNTFTRKSICQNFRQRRHNITNRVCSGYRPDQFITGSANKYDVTLSRSITAMLRGKTVRQAASKDENRSPETGDVIIQNSGYPGGDVADGGWGESKQMTGPEKAETRNPLPLHRGMPRPGAGTAGTWQSHRMLSFTRSNKY